MNKKLSALLAIFLVSVFSFTSCNKKNNESKDKKEVKKVEKKQEVKKAETKEAKKAEKKEVKKEETKAVASSGKLDLSYFPEKAVMVGSFDVKAFLNIKDLEPVYKDLKKEAEKNGIDLNKITFISYYLNVEDLSKEPNDGAVLISGFKFSEDLVKKIGVKYKKEKYSDVDILIDEEKSTCIAVIGNDTIMGSIPSVKKMIDVKKGKIKSLAKSESAKEFNNMIEKSKDAAFRIIVVNNKLGQEQLKNMAKGQGAMIAEFLNNFKSALFSVTITKDAFKFAVKFHSSKAGVDQAMAIAQPQLAMMTQPNSPILGMAQPMLGKEGSEILAKVLKTLQLKKNNDYLCATIETKFEYWKKAPAILENAAKNMK